MTRLRRYSSDPFAAQAGIGRAGVFGGVNGTAGTG